MNSVVQGTLVGTAPEVGSESSSQADMLGVLMFAFAFPPSAVAGTFRTLRFVRYLPDFGWKPLVVTIKPELLPYLPLDPNLTHQIGPETVVERTSLLRPFEAARAAMRSLIPRPKSIQSSGETSPSVCTESTGLLSRVRRLVQSAKQAISLPFRIPDGHINWMIPALRAALRIVRTHRPQVLYSSGPPHSSHLIAVLAKKLTGLPVVIDLRDPWAHCDWSESKGAFQAKMQWWLERYCVSRADVVVLNTESLRTQFCHHYPAELHSKFVTITNGYDPELRQRIEVNLHARYANSSNGHAGEFRLCHPGMLYGERRLQPLVAAICQLNQKGHKIVLEQIGRIHAESELREYIRDLGAEDYIRLLGQQPHEAAIDRMEAADALVILQPGTATQIPSKLFEMLLFRKPILALADSGETSEMIRSYGLGITVSSDDHNAIAVEIENLSTKRSRLTTESAFTKALCDFDGRHLTGKLAAVLTDVANLIHSDMSNSPANN